MYVCIHTYIYIYIYIHIYIYVYICVCVYVPIYTFPISINTYIHIGMALSKYTSKHERVPIHRMNRRTIHSGVNPFTTPAHLLLP